MTRLALIHATPLSLAPIDAALDADWPEAKRMHLLDASLSQDLAAEGHLSPAMIERFVSLARYVKGTGADAILFTCSAFGPAIEAAKVAVGLPTLKPNEAMFDAAVQHVKALERRGHIGLLTTFAPSSVSLRAELEAALRESGVEAKVSDACAPDAMPALGRSDAATHDRLIVEASASLKDCDVILLGQFSMARAQSAVAAATGNPVLTSPQTAVRAMKVSWLRLDLTD